MNKSVGNMYPFVDATINFIKGRCEHNCSYCYVKDIYKRYNRKQVEPYLDEKEFKNLGSGKTIFVGSSFDVFSASVPSQWIERTISHCKKFDNTYLFQTKNPKRFLKFDFPLKTIFGITLESNRWYECITKAPKPRQRIVDFYKVTGGDKMISVEPVMDFNLEIMVDWIKQINPKFVSIGADSKGHHLENPSKEKVDKLIEELEKFTQVKIKSNLERLRRYHCQTRNIK